MASTELRPHTGEATTRQRSLIPALIHLRPSPTRFPQPSLTRSGAESLDGPGPESARGSWTAPGPRLPRAP
ncbi:MAG: hypothetical protein ACJ74K_00815 [Actinomycetes bacterium]